MKWKIPGWAAAAGAVVSLVAALAGGNPFGAILLRVVVSALVAGALGLAAQYVLRRFLPDLGAASAEAPQPGVDILIDEELPLAAREGSRQAEDELGAEPLEGLGEEAFGGGGLGEGVGEPDLAQPEPFPELPAAESLEAQAGGGLSGLEPAARRSGPAEAAEELPPGDTLEALSAADSDVLSEAGAGSVGLRPDVLSDADEAGLPSHRALKAEELEAQLDSVTKGQDPASLAKAVRTFLRKDQEG